MKLYFAICWFSSAMFLFSCLATGAAPYTKRLAVKMAVSFFVLPFAMWWIGYHWIEIDSRDLRRWFECFENNPLFVFVGLIGFVITYFAVVLLSQFFAMRRLQNRFR